MQSTDLLNKDIESITIADQDGLIAKILANVNGTGEMVEIKENISVCIKYTGTDVKTIIHR